MASGHLVWAVGLILAPASAAGTEPNPAPAPISLAERVDLTRITLLEADYAAAVRRRDKADLRAYEAQVLAMLRGEVLPYAPATGQDARVLALAHEFISLEEKMDDASIARKSSILASLKGLAKNAHFPPPTRRGGSGGNARAQGALAGTRVITADLG
jgi:hypothetical protein